jgi:bacteriocin-like protein
MAKAKPELSALSEIGTELDESQLAQVNGGYYWDWYHWEDFAPGGWAYRP